MRKTILILMASCLAACSSKKTNEEAIGPPGKAVLIAPAQNELCTQGTVVSATESTVTLKWNAGENTQGYEVNIKDLEAGTNIVRQTTSTQVDVTLKRNTPYSWYVKSASANNSAVAQSDVWRFYNAGPGTVNYAPFPADLTSPTLGQNVTSTNGKITLAWSGNDVDNDVAAYDVYFGEAPSPPLLLANTTANTANDIAVVSGKQYYWKVVTKDSKNNRSESAINYFKVN